jgi:prepilin-type N-terminal cleavage/methylation domain-containing protein
MMPSHPRKSFMPHHPRGFTMIELLMVIGVIVLLISMLFLGFIVVGKGERKQDTLATMEVAKTMLENYQQATHFNRNPPLPYIVTTGQPANSYFTSVDTSSNFWLAPAKPEVAPFMASLNVNPYPANLPDTSDVKSLQCVQLLRDTACVMYALEQIPSNQTAISNLPVNKTTVVNLEIATNTTPPFQTVKVTLLLDSWGNPIYFVPGNGMYLVKTDSPTNSLPPTLNPGQRIVYTPSAPTFTWYAFPQFFTFAKTVAGAAGNPPTSDPTPGSPIFDPTTWLGFCSPDFKPYWVSGGADGDPSTGDDNVYSFSQ